MLFRKRERQKRGANLPTNRRVSQCSLICLVATNEIIATGLARSFLRAIFFLANSLFSPCYSPPRSCSIVTLDRERETRTQKERSVWSKERGFPEGIGRKIAGKLVSRISLWALLADDGRQRPILRRSSSEASFEQENRVMAQRRGEEAKGKISARWILQMKSAKSTAKKL